MRYLVLLSLLALIACTTPQKEATQPTSQTTPTKGLTLKMKRPNLLAWIPL